LLLFPPFWTSLEAPPLGPALLQAKLLAHGLPARVCDLNLELIHAATAGPLLLELDRLCRDWLAGLERGPLDLPGRLVHERLVGGLATLDDLAGLTCSPAATLREPTILGRPTELHLARRRIGRLQGLLHDLLLPDGRRDPCPATLRRRLTLAQLGTASPVAAWLTRRLRELLRAEPAEVVGLTVHAPEQLDAALVLAHAVRQAAPETLILLGGALLTRHRRGVLATPELFSLVDGVVVYEGETALLRLVEALAHHEDRLERKDYAAIPNLLHLHDGEPRANRLAVEPGLGLPTPAYPDAAWEQYLTPARVAYVEATRGCYHGRCRYCADRFCQLGHRRRPVGQIARWMSDLGQQQGITGLLFTDEALPPDLLAELADVLARGPAPPAWGGEVRPEPAFDEGLLGRLVAVGCRRLQVGVESLSRRLLDRMRRGVTPDDARGFIQAATRHDLPLELFLIDGLPGETDAEQEGTRAELAALSLPVGSWVAYSLFYLDERSGLGEPRARGRETAAGIEVRLPEPDRPGEEVIFRLAGDPHLHAGTRTLAAPVVATPGVEPDWPAEGHLALLWAAAARDRGRGGGRWQPRLERCPLEEERGPRGALRPAPTRAPGSPGGGFVLDPELRLYSSGRDPLVTRAELAAVALRIRAERFAGARVEEASRRALAEVPERLPDPTPSFFLFDLRGGGWLRLDPSHALLLSLLDGRRGLDELAACFAERSPDPLERLRPQIALLLDGFAAWGIVVPGEATGGSAWARPSAGT